MMVLIYMVSWRKFFKILQWNMQIPGLKIWKFVFATNWRARRCPWKAIFFLKILTFLAYVTPKVPMSVRKKFQLIRSSRLAGQREHI